MWVFSMLCEVVLKLTTLLVIDLLPLSPPHIFALFALSTISLGSPLDLPCFSYCLLASPAVSLLLLLSPCFSCHLLASPATSLLLLPPPCFSCHLPTFPAVSLDLSSFSLVLHCFSLVLLCFSLILLCFSLISLLMSLISITIALNYTCLIWKVLSPTITPP